MRKLLRSLAIPTLFVFTQVAHAQSTAVTSRVYEGEQQLSHFTVNPTKTTSAESEEVAQPAVIHQQPDAPAPNLTGISTFNTCSAATSSSMLVCEYDANSYTTTNHYPTSDYKVYEVVRVYGYSSQTIAKLGGSTGAIVPTSDLVETDLLCGSNYAYCQTGQTVTGFQYWYDLTSMLAQGYPRQFYVQATGSNNPGTTVSAGITIQQ